ncbi:MAG TPA: hypothetical protein VFJ97_17170 [Dermatophilaceae bacterium]|nr:hypothetical protein [Dermatophilaceae bacterium]
MRSVTLLVTTTLLLSTTTGCGVGAGLAGIKAPPVAVTTDAALSTEQARSVLRRQFTAAQQAAPGAATAPEASAAAYTGPALLAAQARLKLGASAGGTGGPAALAPEQPGLLAVSRGVGYPRALLAQTIPSSNALPVLHLLVSPDVATPFRIASSATMLPASSVQPFAAPGAGSPLVTDGLDLAVRPAALFDAYAQALSFATTLPASAPFATDPFLAQVRLNATNQARAVVTQASFVQKHEVVPGSIYAVQQADGAALAFGVLRRTDTFTVKPGQTITAPADFVALVPGKSRITRTAVMQTLEFLVFEVPKRSGPAVLVAAQDQLVAGSGA